MCFSLLKQNRVMLISQKFSCYTRFKFDSSNMLELFSITSTEDTYVFITLSNIQDVAFCEKNN